MMLVKATVYAFVSIPITVLGGLQLLYKAVTVNTLYVSFDTDNGIRRATTIIMFTNLFKAAMVSIPITVLGGLQREKKDFGPSSLF